MLQGASVVLYKNEDIRKYQIFAYSLWPGGLFGSPSMAGSRPGQCAWYTSTENGFMCTNIFVYHPCTAVCILGVTVRHFVDCLSSIIGSEQTVETSESYILDFEQYEINTLA